MNDQSMEYEERLDLRTRANQRLLQCSIDGRRVAPVALWVTFVWKQFARHLSCSIGWEKLSIEISDFKVRKFLFLFDEESLTLNARIETDGSFEISIDGTIYADGTIAQIDPGSHASLDRTSTHRDYRSLSLVTLKANSADHQTVSAELNSNDFYRVLQSLGIRYGDELRCIRGILFEDNCACLDWCTDWLLNIESHVQARLCLLPVGRRPEYVTGCSKITIQPRLLKKTKRPDASGLVTEAIYDEERCAITSTAMQMCNITTAALPGMSKTEGDIALRYRDFFPYFETGIRDHDDPLLTAYFELLRRHTHRIMVQLIDAGHFINSPILPQELLQTVLTQAKSDKQLNDLDSLMGAFDLADPMNAILRDLRQVLTESTDVGFVEHCQKVMKHTQESLSTDRLLGNCLRERILAPCVLTAVENSSSNLSLKVVAFVTHEAMLTCLQSVEHIVRSQSSHTQFTCLVLGGTRRSATKVGQIDVLHITQLGDGSQFIEEADLVISVNCITRQSSVGECLTVLQSCMKDDAFLLLLEPSCTLLIPIVIFIFDGRQSPVHDVEHRACGQFCDDLAWVKQLAGAGLETVSQKSDSFVFTLFLCKKIQTNPQSLQTIYKNKIEVSNNDFTWISQMEKKLSEADSTVWVQKAGNFHTGLDKLMHIYKKNSNNNSLKCVMTSVNNGKGSLPETDIPEMTAMHKKNLAFNVFNGQCWGAYYSCACKKHLSMQILQHARLHNIEGELKWVQANPPQQQDGKIQCHVYSVLMQTFSYDNLEAKESDVMSFSGRDSTGKRVFGLSFGDILSTSISTHPMFLWEVPLNWTLSQAATVPQDYAMVYYGMYMLSVLENHDDVVVIGAATPCGIAASTITMFAGHDVAVVVESNRERDYVCDVVGLGRIYKRSEDYQERVGIRNGSHNRCLVVYTGVNPLMDFEDDAEFLSGTNTQILLIGDVDTEATFALADTHKLNVDVMTPGMLSSERYKRQAVKVAAMIVRGMEAGFVKPFGYNAFTTHQMSELFQTDNESTSFPYKKTLFQFREDDGNHIGRPRALTVKGIPRTECYADHVYIVCSDHKSSLLTSAYWLAAAGARNIVLVYRDGITEDMNPYVMKLLQNGVKVFTSKADITKLKETVQLFKVAARYGDIGGVIFSPFTKWQSIVKQEPQRLRNMKDRFDWYAKPLLAVTVHLDRVTRQLCHHSLHLFIIYSWHQEVIEKPHISSFIESFMEKICQQRRCDDLPGVSIRKDPPCENSKRVFIIQHSLQMMDKLMCLPFPVIEYSCPDDDTIEFSDEEVCDDAPLLPSRAMSEENLTVRTPLHIDTPSKVHHFKEQGHLKQLDKNSNQVPKRYSSEESLSMKHTQPDGPTVSTRENLEKRTNRKVTKKPETVELPKEIIIPSTNGSLFIDETSLKPEQTIITSQPKEEPKQIIENNNPPSPQLSPTPVAPKRKRPKSWHCEEKVPEDTDGKLSTISEGIMLRSNRFQNKYPDVFSKHEHNSPKPPPRRRRSQGSASDENDGHTKPAPEAINFLTRLFAPQNLLVRMNSHSASPTKQSHPLFVVHTEEGTVRSMIGCMQNIQPPVYGLQCTDGAPLNSVDSLVAFYLKKIQTLYPKGPYCLVGYGLSSCVAFQLALEMQRQGQTVNHLVLLNGSPTLKPSMTVPEKNIHRNLLYAYIAIREYISVPFDKFSTALGREYGTWTSLINRTVEFLIDSTEDSAIQGSDVNKWKIFLNQYCHILKAVEEYSPRGKLKDTEIVLIKPQESPNQESQDLSHLCTGPVSVQTVQGSSKDFLLGSKGQQIAKIINRILVQEVSCDESRDSLPQQHKPPQRPERHRRKRILSDPGIYV